MTENLQETLNAITSSVYGSDIRTAMYTAASIINGDERALKSLADRCDGLSNAALAEAAAILSVIFKNCTPSQKSQIEALPSYSAFASKINPEIANVTVANVATGLINAGISISDPSDPVAVTDAFKTFISDYTRRFTYYTSNSRFTADSNNRFYIANFTNYASINISDAKKLEVSCQLLSDSHDQSPSCCILFTRRPSAYYSFESLINGGGYPVSYVTDHIASIESDTVYQLNANIRFAVDKEILDFYDMAYLYVGLVTKSCSSKAKFDITITANRLIHRGVT